MQQYRGVVKKHTSFTLDLLRNTPDGRVFRYVSNFRSALPSIIPFHLTIRNLELMKLCVVLVSMESLL